MRKNSVAEPEETKAAGAPDGVELHPNIVIILAGDLGYGDLKYLGGELRKIAAPNVDRLASQGTRLDEPSETNTPFSFA